LAEESILSDDLVRQLMAVGEVDILVGLHTYNHARTVAQVVQAVRAGLLNYFPRARVAILNADGGSKDDSPALVQAASISDARNSEPLHTLRTLHSISARYSGNPSAGTALRIIVAAADLLQAKACAVVAPESSTITPEWVERLLRPIFRDGFDFVTPAYSRHRFDGLLVTNLLYPMTRALFGYRVREPNPSEFAFSYRFANQILADDLWCNDPGRTGPELCLTLAAIEGGFRLHQSFLGTKTHLEQTSADLVTAMRQTVGTLFWALGRNEKSWTRPHEGPPLQAVGPEYEITTEPLRINRKRLHQMFCSGVAQLEPVLASILASPTLEELKRDAGLCDDDFRYSDELWVKTIYECAASYHRAVISPDHIIQAMAPLYRGRVYTFLMENREASEQQVEESIERLCITFEQLKPYLLESWAAGKGGS
jgi:hypothetical protein